MGGDNNFFLRLLPGNTLLSVLSSLLFVCFLSAAQVISRTGHSLA